MVMRRVSNPKRLSGDKKVHMYSFFVPENEGKVFHNSKKTKEKLQV
jgi:hypothetical protein